MTKEEYYSRLKKTSNKLLTDRCSYEEIHNIRLQQIYLKDKYIQTLEKENQQLKKQKDDVVEYIKTTTYSDITGLEKHNITEFWFIKDLLRMLGETDEI